MKGQKIVITGGAGFIGSNLAEALATENDVVIMDDLSSGRLQNIEHLIKRPNVRFIQGSITDLSLVREAFHGVNYVFHQAAVASVPLSIRDPLCVNEVNVHGTLNVLVAAHEHFAKKVIFASSCAVYGDASVTPVREDMPPNPLSPYTVTKVTGEHYCEVFHRIYRLPTVCLRYFNVYGPRQNPHSEYAAVIPIFFSRALNNQPLTIFGDGNQTRDFIFVQDVVRANIMVAGNEAQGIYNIGTGTSVSINMLAKTVMAVTGKRLEIIYQRAREGDIVHSRADISRIKGIGYRPRFDLEEGLRETHRFYQELME